MEDRLEWGRRCPIPCTRVGLGIPGMGEGEGGWKLTPCKSGVPRMTYYWRLLDGRVWGSCGWWGDETEPHGSY